MDEIRVCIKENNGSRFWAIYILGSLNALKRNAISLDEAERCIFTPFMADAVCATGCDSFVTDMIWKGCELENIKSVIPNKYDKILDQMIHEIELWLNTKDNSLEKWVSHIGKDNG